MKNIKICHVYSFICSQLNGISAFRYLVSITIFLIPCPCLPLTWRNFNDGKEDKVWENSLTLTILDLPGWFVNVIDRSLTVINKLDFHLFTYLIYRSVSSHSGARGRCSNDFERCSIGSFSSVEFEPVGAPLHLLPIFVSLIPDPLFFFTWTDFSCHRKGHIVKDGLPAIVSDCPGWEVGQEDRSLTAISKQSYH